MSRYFTVDLGYHATQCLARTALCEVVSTVGNHVLHTLCPAHARCQLGNQVLLDLSSIGMRLAVDVLVDRSDGLLELSLLNGGLQFVLGRLHQRRVEGTTHLQRHGTLGTGSLQLLASLVDGIDIARDNQLTWVVVVGRNHHALAQLADFGANLFDLLVWQTDDGSHR